MNFGFQISDFRFQIILLLISLFFVFGCQSVQKPAREDAGDMTIIIEAAEAPVSHTAHTTSDGAVLVNPYEKIPVLGKMFKSSLKGLDWWKANHPNLVSGTIDPSLNADKDEACLDCHDQKTSCNNCHRYVGVNLVTSSK